MLKKGMTAVVTGGAQGIGRYICLSLASRGVKVYSLDVKHDKNLETLAMMKKLTEDCHAVNCDICNPIEVGEVFDEIFGAEERIDVLVNNAAVFSVMSFVNDSYEDAIQDYSLNLDTNLRGAFLCMKKVAPVMAKHGQGEIINVITNHLKRSLFPPSDTEHSYDASKFALFALNQTAASELKKFGIRVNAVCPASTRSPMLEEYFHDIGRELTIDTIGEVAGFKSLLEPEEVAETVCEMMNWKKSEPSGNAYLLMYSEDCSELSQGHSERLAIQ